MPSWHCIQAKPSLGLAQRRAKRAGPRCVAASAGEPQQWAGGATWAGHSLLTLRALPPAEEWNRTGTATMGGWRALPHLKP